MVMKFNGHKEIFFKIETGIHKIINVPFCSELLRLLLCFQASKVIKQMKCITLNTFLILLTFYYLNYILNTGLLTCNRVLSV